MYFALHRSFTVFKEPLLIGVSSAVGTEVYLLSIVQNLASEAYRRRQVDVMPNLAPKLCETGWQRVQ